MVLQALTQYYETLVQASVLAGLGWGSVRASYALLIAASRALEQATSIQAEQLQGKKTVLASQVLTLPVPVKCIVGITTNFLCDNSGYILGTGSKDNPQRSLTCFAVRKTLHASVLGGVASPSAQAPLTFFRTWIPKYTLEHPALAEYREDILSGANLLFRHNGSYIHEDPGIRRARKRRYRADTDSPRGICLIAGEEGPMESVHPAIRNVSDAQSSGAALVSFSAPAFCSYGEERDLNAPAGRYAAFAYTAALNYLLTDRKHIYRLRDATVICQARDGGGAYQAFFGGALLGASTPYSAADLHGTTTQLCQGIPVDFRGGRLGPSMDFYVLSLSPNAARLSVRFFLHNIFQGFLDHIRAHYDHLGIAQSNDNKFDSIPLWYLLYATVQSQTKYEPSSYKEAKQNLEKYLPPELSGEILRSTLMSTRYPATLLNGVTLCIRAEHEITRSRTVAIKAYLLQSYHFLPIYSALREVLTVELNDSCNYQPYVLDRLFAVMEQIQLASADQKLNRTIRDNYFTSVVTTPKNIYAELFPLNEYHMEELLCDRPGLTNILGKEKGSPIGKLTAPVPPRFMPEETDCSHIGYYHQNDQKEEEKECV